MRVVIRADASHAIGSGHVMRCRTLGQVLRERGHEVIFACRELEGDLLGLLRESGFAATSLRAAKPGETDAQQTLAAIAATADWVVVDHYGLDAQWERDVRAGCKKLLALDDLANRPHDCDLLLDQNLTDGSAQRYAGLLPAGTRQLLGPSWALVRPQFAAQRAASLARRADAHPRTLLVFMGGGDVLQDVETAIAGALASQVTWTRIDVVVGAGCPGQERLAHKLAQIPGANLHVQTEAMPQLMLNADVALTAAGSVSWEKCCMGLPSLVTVLADNQAEIAQALHVKGAAVSLGRSSAVRPSDYSEALDVLDSHRLASMSALAAEICKGDGAMRVALELEQELER